MGHQLITSNRRDSVCVCVCVSVCVCVYLFACAYMIYAIMQLYSVQYVSYYASCVCMCVVVCLHSPFHTHPAGDQAWMGTGIEIPENQYCQFPISRPSEISGSLTLRLCWEWKHSNGGRYNSTVRSVWPKTFSLWVSWPVKDTLRWCIWICGRCSAAICWSVLWPIYSGIAEPCLKGCRTEIAMDEQWISLAVSERLSQ